MKGELRKASKRRLALVRRDTACGLVTRYEAHTGERGAELGGVVDVGLVVGFRECPKVLNEMVGKEGGTREDIG